MPTENPCEPTPCGPNSQCRVISDTPSCSCLSEFVGAPPNCRPECVSNSECPSRQACVNQKCRDPCPGSCGANAECRVVSHTPMCVCPNDYTGDPFTQCVSRPRKNRCFFPQLFNFPNIRNYEEFPSFKDLTDHSSGVNVSDDFESF